MIFANANPEWMDILIDTVKESLSKVSEISEKTSFIFDEKLEIEEEAMTEFLSDDSTPILMNAIIEGANEYDELSFDDAKGFMKKVQKKTGIKGKNLFMPVRVALTGTAHGPELVNVIYLLGKEKIILRAKHILEANQ